MIIRNVHINDYEGLQSITVSNEKIKNIGSTEVVTDDDEDKQSIIFDNAIAFPGLINSHDHLDFNLFPRLGNQVYKSYMEWGTDIHRQNKDIINSILRIPKELRIEWGVYKNLLNGVTTVVQHGERFNIEKPVINIFQDCYSLHSVGLEKHWELRLNRPFVKNQPFVIHIGEGTDVAAFKEINKLIKWNLFKRNLIAIHGVAMNPEQAKSFKALVWCPDSNFFLLGTTANIRELKKSTKIIFGTDSTVSADWNIWEQIRLARKTGLLTDQELFDSLTCLPASVWGFDDRGILSGGKIADIVVAKMKGKKDSMDSFFKLNPEDILLVVRKGKIILFDEMLYAQLNRNIILREFGRIFINNIGKYVKGNLTELTSQIKKYPIEIKLPIEIE